jgi:signal transduction histidine kinase
MACSESSTSIFAKTPGKETNTMSSAQPPGYHETPAMAHVMPHNVMSYNVVPHNVTAHIALPDGNNHQADRGEHDGLDRVFEIALGERSAAEQCARAAQRLAALGEMTGGIVHDFRNLLAGIESGLRLTEKSSEQPEKVRVYIAAAREGIDRGMKLTSRLLAFATQQEQARAPSRPPELAWWQTAGATVNHGKSFSHAKASASQRKELQSSGCG